jgi:predicted RNase H-like HicB family nuclease
MKKELHIMLDIEKLPEGFYLATSRDVQGLVVQAKTFEKTIEVAEDVARQILHAQKGKQVRQERIMYPMVIAA